MNWGAAPGVFEEQHGDECGESGVREGEGAGGRGPCETGLDTVGHVRPLAFTLRTHGRV